MKVKIPCFLNEHQQIIITILKKIVAGELEEIQRVWLARTFNCETTTITEVYGYLLRHGIVQKLPQRAPQVMASSSKKAQVLLEEIHATLEEFANYARTET